MIIKEKYKNIFLKKYDKLITWCGEQEVSFLAYMGALISLIISGIFLVEKTGINYNIFHILFASLFIFGFLYDSIKIIRIYHGKFLGRLILLIISIILYFAYLQSESMAQSTISVVTGVDSDFFQTSVSYFKGIYFIPAFMILLGKNVVSIFLIALIFFYTSIFMIPRWKHLKKKFLHISLYFLSLVIIFFYFFNLNIEAMYTSIFGKKYIPEKIIEYSYHKNTHCTNITNGVYINFLEDDWVSVSNISAIGIGAGNDESDITFERKKCKRKVSI